MAKWISCVFIKVRDGRSYVFRELPEEVNLDVSGAMVVSSRAMKTSDVLKLLNRKSNSETFSSDGWWRGLVK